MAIAMKCDICGVFFPYKGREVNHVSFNRKTPSATGGTLNTDKSHDICPACRDALEEVLNERSDIILEEI